MKEKQQTNTESLGVTTNAEKNQINLDFGKEQINETYGKTPVRIMGNAKGYTAVLGPYRILGLYKSKEEVQVELENPTLEMLINVMGIMIELQRQEDKK